MNKKIRVAEYALVAIIEAIIFFTMAAYYNVAPFGSQLPRGGDTASQCISYFCHIWDAMHGNQPLFYDWMTTMGTGFVGVIASFSLLDPIVLLFYFFKREYIVAAYVIYIIVRLILLGWTMCFFLNHNKFTGTKKLSPYFIVMGSVFYGFSGYAVQYMQFGWMNIGIYLPLLILCLHGMLDTEGRRPGKYSICYTILLALMMIINVAVSYAVCLFLVAFVGGWILIVRKKENRRARGCVKFMVCSVLAAGCASFIVISAVYNIGQSIRGGMNGYIPVIGTYISCMTIFGTEYEKKWKMFFSVAAILLFFLIALVKRIKDKNWNRMWSFRLFMFIWAMLPIVFERINLLWHNGPYVNFPMRHGFISVFVLIVLGLDGISELNMIFSSKRIYKALKRIIPLGLIPSCVIMFSWFTAPSMSPSLEVYEEVQNMRSEEGLGLLDRSKNINTDWQSNYPMYIGNPGLSCYFTLLQSRVSYYLIRMGYPKVWMNIYDNGGTVFSDALLMIDTPFTNKSKQENIFFDQSEDLQLYEYMSEVSGYTFYRSNYTYPLGLYVDSDSYMNMPNGLENQNPFVNQNILSKLLFNEEFIEISNYKVDELTENALQYTFNLNGNKAIYIYSPAFKNVSTSADSNGITVIVNDFENPPADDYCGTITLGNYKDQEVVVNVVSSNGTLPIDSDISIGVLDLDKFTASVTNAKSGVTSYEIDGEDMQLSVSSDRNGYILLPIYADEGWQCYVDGEATEISRLDDALMMIPVTEGEHSVYMHYLPKRMNVSIKLSLFAAIIALGFIIVPNIVKLKSKDRFVAMWDKTENILGIGFNVIWVLFMAMFAVWPVIYTWIRFVLDRV